MTAIIRGTCALLSRFFANYRLIILRNNGLLCDQLLLIDTNFANF